ncbi:MAG: hypothetical protein H7A01_13950 [Hahellaceae bacterium]|nr:hypothetical protein [Hahellaceae bacterium]MCP5210159.1 hypothetical protein [Hahellaceae bacterium]
MKVTTKTNRLFRHGVILVSSALCLCAPVRAELLPMKESELASQSGQAGLSIEVQHLRINAHESGSVDNPATAANEGDGRRTKGFHLDYVTKEHGGGGESHYFANEVSLALDTEGALTVDVGGDGALVIGLPTRMNFVGDGFSVKDIYLNNTGNVAGGGKLYNEQNIIGNFNTGGTITMWGSN